MTEVYKQWYKVFEDLGLSLQALNAGCCGMAGTFGHEKANQDLSAELYQMSWQEHVQTYQTTLLVTGFSCRSQIKRFEGFQVKHPIQIIAQLSKSN
jgi:Fe-S oxidoreductase